MKDNFIHVCFVIDESGSMAGSVSDVVGGFKKTIDDQKENKTGSCSVSLYKFNSTVKKIYVGKDVSEVEPLSSGHGLITNILKDYSVPLPPLDTVYSPSGCTALYDGVGKAITEVGKWCADMPEEERPSKNLIVIMTDGEENSSREFTAQKIKDMIKEQEDKYNWTFVYMGTDITTTEGADTLGFKNQVYSTRANHSGNWGIVNCVASAYRCAAESFDNALDTLVDTANTLYESETGHKVKKNRG